MEELIWKRCWVIPVVHAYKFGKVQVRVAVTEVPNAWKGQVQFWSRSAAPVMSLTGGGLTHFPSALLKTAPPHAVCSDRSNSTFNSHKGFS